MHELKWEEKNRVDATFFGQANKNSFWLKICKQKSSKDTILGTAFLFWLQNDIF